MAFEFFSGINKSCFWIFIFLIGCSGCATTPRNTAASEPLAEKKSAERTAVAAPKTAEKVDFAPVYCSDKADPYYDAHRIYASSPKASTGLYRYAGLVFVIIEIDTGKEHIGRRLLEGSAMLRVKGWLREAYPKLPARYYVQGRVLEKGMRRRTRIYRYAEVYRDADLQRLCRK